MLLVHFSDLHLGHRAYERADRGKNVRERDVGLAFQRAVQEVIKLKPDLVFLVGDIFDRPDPPPSALVALAQGLEALRSAIPSTQIFMVAGARDTPRPLTDPGALAALDPFPNVEAVTGRARSVFLRELETRPDLAVGYRFLGRHLVRTGKIEEGSKYLERASRLFNELGIYFKGDKHDPYTFPPVL